MSNSNKDYYMEIRIGDIFRCKFGLYYMLVIERNENSRENGFSYNLSSLHDGNRYTDEKFWIREIGFGHILVDKEHRFFKNMLTKISRTQVFESLAGIVRKEYE
jgi:hypothetical protein